MFVKWGDRRLPERFWSKITPVAPEGCWLWTGSLDTYGYGSFWFDGKMRIAHRHAFKTLLFDPEGLVLDHVCRNRDCVNPVHLEPVTQKTNIRRGRTGQHMKLPKYRAMVSAQRRAGAR